MLTKESAFLLALLTFGGACRESPPDPVAKVPPPLETQILSVNGRKSSTAFVVSRGDLIAAVWSADQEGATDIFLATSNDAGRTFSEPRRVNDVPGDVNVYGEQPQRAANWPRLGGA